MPKRRRLVKLTSKKKLKSMQDDDAFDDTTLPDFSTARSLAGFIEGAADILGDVDTTKSLENLSYTTNKYNAEKTRVINRFYKIISLHPSLTRLTETVTDPHQENGERITRFAFLCRGVRTKPKKKNRKHLHDAYGSEPAQEGCNKAAKLVEFLGGQETFHKRTHSCLLPAKPHVIVPPAVVQVFS